MSGPEPKEILKAARKTIDDLALEIDQAAALLHYYTSQASDKMLKRHEVVALQHATYGALAMCPSSNPNKKILEARVQAFKEVLKED